jgi:hypothetical protein
MLISTIVLIILRLFSVQWLVFGLSTSAVALAILPELSGQESILPILPNLVSGVGMLACSIVTWLVAPPLARFIAGKYDTTMSVSGLSLFDLYAFAFVFLGLYFVLKSVANFLYWFQFSLWIAASHGDSDPQRKQALSEFVRPLITLVAGLVCMFSGKRWARKLCDRGQES